LPAADDQNPPWLKGRLEQAKAAALADLGITDPSKAKATLDAAKKAEDDAKSAAERLGETNKALEQEKARVASLTSAVDAIVAERKAALTDDQKAAVNAALAVAGLPDSDSAATLRIITALAPTWKQVAATASTAVTSAHTSVVTPNVPTAPANTAPAGGSPPPAAGSPPDHKAEYQRLKAKSPVAAAAYMNQHADKIYPRA